MLIVEGTDGVGKTTLCKSLLTRLAGRGYVYAHFTRLPEGFDYFWGYAARASRAIVQDRFHLSEVAYATACGRPSQLNPWEYRLVDAKLRLTGAFTVLVLADEVLTRSRWDPTQMYDLETTVRAGRAFANLAARQTETALGGIYLPDIDFIIRCTRNDPFPDEYAADQIFRLYSQRQQCLEAVIARKPLTIET